MKKLGLYVLTFAALLIWPGSTWGKNEGLKGLKEVRPYLASLSSDAEKCDLTEEKLLSAIEKPISLSRIKQSDSAKVFFYVTVNTIHLAWTNFCISNVRIEVYTNQFVELAVTTSYVPVTMTLWDAAVLFGAPTDSHLDQVVRALETRTRKFVADWTAVQ